MMDATGHNRTRHMARLDTPKRCATRSHTTPHNTKTTRHDTTRLDPTRPNMTPHDTTRHTNKPHHSIHNVKCNIVPHKHINTHAPGRGLCDHRSVIAQAPGGLCDHKPFLQRSIFNDLAMAWPGHGQVALGAKPVAQVGVPGDPPSV